VINVRLSNGDYLVTDKDVTGFSWPEEELAQRGEAVPFSLQDDLKESAGKYTLADQPFDTYVLEDGRLITGQNPGSAKAVAGAVAKQLS
jgi:putative intracellular protease/amidase